MDSWVVMILVYQSKPLSVGVIAHPHTHALGASTPPAPPQQDGRWDCPGKSQTLQLVGLREQAFGFEAPTALQGQS
ncbi:MAG: hypothetical protein ACRCY0_08390 [Synechococcus elongatus]|uniref:hypothetical protein n=1 Tax=Synechococcus elongatus TaxID=32046 RepID=UPI00030C4081